MLSIIQDSVCCIEIWKKRQVWAASRNVTWEWGKCQPQDTSRYASQICSYLILNYSVNKYYCLRRVYRPHMSNQSSSFLTGLLVSGSPSTSPLPVCSVKGTSSFVGISDASLADIGKVGASSFLFGQLVATTPKQMTILPVTLKSCTSSPKNAAPKTYAKTTCRTRQSVKSSSWPRLLNLQVTLLWWPSTAFDCLPEVLIQRIWKDRTTALPYGNLIVTSLQEDWRLLALFLALVLYCSHDWLPSIHQQ